MKKLSGIVSLVLFAASLVITLYLVFDNTRDYKFHHCVGTTPEGLVRGFDWACYDQTDHYYTYSYQYQNKQP